MEPLQGGAVKNEILMTALMMHAFGGTPMRQNKTLQIDPKPKLVKTTGKDEWYKKEQDARRKKHMKRKKNEAIRWLPAIAGSSVTATTRRMIRTKLKKCHNLTKKRRLKQ